MSAALIIATYGSGLFGANDQNTNQEDWKAFRGSAFNSIYLWSLHVHENGDLYYNNDVIVSEGSMSQALNPQFPSLLQGLREGGLGTILFSIGAGGPPEPKDYHNIQNLLATSSGTEKLERNFSALAAWLSLDGFDFDDEENGISVDTLKKLTLMLAKTGRKGIITAAPWGVPPESYWLEVMKAAFDATGVQPFKWWNLQVYRGADPSSWISTMAGYIQDNDIGVTDPNGFIVPGYRVSEACITCKDFQQDSSLNVGGGFLWNSESILGSGIHQRGLLPRSLTG